MLEEEKHSLIDIAYPGSGAASVPVPANRITIRGDNNNMIEVFAHMTRRRLIGSDERGDVWLDHDEQQGESSVVMTDEPQHL